jgi:hypothetical protein
MANAEQQKQQQDPQPQSTQQAAPQPRKAAAPTAFGDGSTQEQQDRLINEAEEANAATKRFADTEREARSS